MRREWRAVHEVKPRRCLRSARDSSYCRLRDERTAARAREATHEATSVATSSSTSTAAKTTAASTATWGCRDAECDGDGPRARGRYGRRGLPGRRKNDSCAPPCESAATGPCPSARSPIDPATYDSCGVPAASLNARCELGLVHLRQRHRVSWLPSTSKEPSLWSVVQRLDIPAIRTPHDRVVQR